jgi:hypothetical protein
MIHQGASLTLFSWQTQMPTACYSSIGKRKSETLKWRHLLEKWQGKIAWICFPICDNGTHYPLNTSGMVKYNHVYKVWLLPQS